MGEWFEIGRGWEQHTSSPHCSFQFGGHYLEWEDKIAGVCGGPREGWNFGLTGNIIGNIMLETGTKGIQMIFKIFLMSGYVLMHMCKSLKTHPKVGVACGGTSTPVGI